MVSISKDLARKVALHAQGLIGTQHFGSGAGGTLRCIQQLGYVQIDTISVVERAHHHVLWSRDGKYVPAHLERLQRERKIFEYWSHAAAYLPIEHYRFCRRRMMAFQNGASHWFPKDKKIMRAVLDRIRAEGPLTARDFEDERGKTAGPWWDWKPAKRALEQLFMEGKLLVAGRRNFQKVYDLPERVLPADLDTTVPDDREFAKHLIRTAIRAHGFASEAEICYLRKGMRAPVRAALAGLLECGEITAVRIEGLESPAYYAAPAAFDTHNFRHRRSARLLSPFDNAAIQRKRLLRLFDYHYQLECYLPAAKRRFGYFCLPLLLGTRFVGRIDAKADRKTRTLRLFHAAFEPGFTAGGRDLALLAQAVAKLARFQCCERIALDSASPAGLHSPLQQALAGLPAA